MLAPIFVQAGNRHGWFSNGHQRSFYQLILNTCVSKDRMHRYFIRKFISLDLGYSIYIPECISLKNWNCEKPCRQSWYNENYIVFFLKFLKLFKCKWECSGCRLWDRIVKYVGTENYHQIMLIYLDELKYFSRVFQIDVILF